MHLYSRAVFTHMQGVPYDLTIMASNLEITPTKQISSCVSSGL